MTGLAGSEANIETRSPIQGVVTNHGARLQRDVPGLTRAAIPAITNEDWLRGVKALSVGVNSGSAPPGVPHNRPFIWRDPPTGAQIIAMWHPGTPPAHRTGFKIVLN